LADPADPGQQRADADDLPGEPLVQAVAHGDAGPLTLASGSRSGRAGDLPLERIDDAASAGGKVDVRRCQLDTGHRSPPSCGCSSL
jgi:hypothetical protein